jgi:AAHS family 3-hydroxyphenylpropionic acid transporter
MSTESQVQSMGRSGTLTLALCVLIAVFEGFDLQAAGVAAPKLAPALGLSPQQLGWFFSSSTFGLMAGAAIGGRLSDRYGRKVALLTSIFLFGLLSINTGMAGNVEQLLAARFMTGVGLGGALPNLIALVAENMPLNRRSAAIGMLYAGMPCGGAMASLTSLIGAHPADWRMIFYIGGVAPLALLPLVWLALPDSVAALHLRHSAGGRTRTGVFRAVFGEGRARVTAVLWLGFFLALLIMYLLLNWLPSLLIGRGLTRADAAFVQVAFNVFGALGSVATGLLMDHRRWRTVTAIGVFTAAALSFAAVSVAPASLTAWLAIGAALGATVSGCQSTLYGFAPSCYPTSVRGTGVGAGVSIGRLGSAAGPLLAAQMVAAGFSPTHVLLALLPAVAVAGIATTALSRRPAVDS